MCTFSYYYIYLCIFLHYYYFFHIILLHHPQLCFFVQIANVHFHHQEVSQYIVTHVIMITTIPLPSSSTTSQGYTTKYYSTNKTSINDILNMSSTKKQKHPMQIIQQKLISIINNPQTIV